MDSGYLGPAQLLNAIQLASLLFRVNEDQREGTDPSTHGQAKPQLS
jgi:hypothetical protein